VNFVHCLRTAFIDTKFGIALYGINHVSGQTTCFGNLNKVGMSRREIFMRKHGGRKYGDHKAGSDVGKSNRR
jgi:hypothetical protein